MSEVVGEGVVRIRTDESGVNFAKSGKDAGAGYSKGFTSSLKGLAGAIGVTVAAKGAVDFVKGSLSAARESQKVAATTEQIIKSTGGAAQVTAAQVGELTTALSKKTGVDDELIQSGANLVLTFKNVQNAGEGVDAIFDRTNAAALDLAAAGFGSVESASLQLGKALNDPIKGMSALARSGVTFTDVQKDQVKAMVATGDLLGAQKIVLAEVESQVGGVAEATATAGDRAKVAFGNMQEAIGGALLPAVDGLANLFTNQLVPALSVAGGLAEDAAGAFGDLPGPVKLAAGAFVALRIAAATGIFSSGGAAFSGIASRVTGSVDGLRIRTLLAKDAFAAASVSGGRMAGTLAAIRAGATGAGTAVKGFLAAALPIAALTAGISIYAKFKQSQEEAKQRVKDLTASLDEQTGAITENTSETIFKALQDSGAIDAAKEYGIALDDLRLAALGDEAAIARVNTVLDAQKAALVEATGAQSKQSGAAATALIQIESVRKAIGGQNDELNAAKEAWEDQAEFTGESADATDVAADSMDNYATQIAAAKTALRKLIDLENERREDLISDRRDQIALNQAIKSAREEAREGAGSREGTQAEQDANEAALLDLVDQFNDSTNKVRRAEFGATRRELLRLAETMQIPKKEAEELAELLRVPKDPVNIKFQSEGYQELIEQINAAIAAAQRLDNLGTIGVGPNRANQGNGLATGTTSWRGGHTWVGEEGPEIVNLPRGTEVIPAPESARIAAAGQTNGGMTVRIERMMPHNYSEFQRQMLEQERAAGIGGRPVFSP